MWRAQAWPPPSTLDEAAAAKPVLSTCFQGGNWSSIPSPPLLLIGSYSMNEMFPKFDPLMHRIWSQICDHCALRCHVRKVGEPYSLRASDVLIDPHWALPLDAMYNKKPTSTAAAFRMVFYHWDPGKMGKYFHFNGNLLETVGAAESFAAQAMRTPRGMAMVVRVNQEMRSSGGFVFNWRKVLTHLGFAKPQTTRIMNTIVSPMEANWTRELLAHMLAYKAG